MAAVFVCGAALRKQRPPRRRFRGGFLIWAALPAIYVALTQIKPRPCAARILRLGTETLQPVEGGNHVVRSV